MIEIFFRNRKVKLDQQTNLSINQQVDTFDQNSDYSHYEKRGQNKLETMRHQNRVGKKGEFFSAAFFHNLGFPYVAPDTNIYPKGQKSWAADLIYTDKPSVTIGNETITLDQVHVKSCDIWTRDRYGMSWSFQYADSDGQGKDALFKNKSLGNDLVAFVYMEDEYTNVAEIIAIMPWKNIQLGALGLTLLAPPTKASLCDYKKCVYDRTIQQFIEEVPEYVKIIG